MGKSDLFWDAGLEELKQGYTEEKIRTIVYYVTNELKKVLSIPIKECSMRLNALCAFILKKSTFPPSIIY